LDGHRGLERRTCDIEFGTTRCDAQLLSKFYT
jgi:hypothetical protein